MEIVAGHHEYCNKNVNNVRPECKFSESFGNHSIVIQNFSSCDVKTQYIPDLNVVSLCLIICYKSKHYYFLTTATWE